MTEDKNKEGNKQSEICKAEHGYGFEAYCIREKCKKCGAVHTINLNSNDFYIIPKTDNPEKWVEITKVYGMTTVSRSEGGNVLYKTKLKWREDKS